VLALLALAAFPVFAHAGGIPEYELEKEQTELPGSQTSVKPKPHGGQHASPNNPAAEGSDVGAENNPGSKSGSPEESESETSSSGGGGGTHSGGGGNNSGGAGDESTSKPQSESKVGVGQKVATEGNKPRSSSSGGSSSPVVPILIAVAVLAAISIGVVLYRQRQGDSGPGSDRRVSSPDAS
jgi:cobalamin biosynthesis Mg chelatase CobN